MESLFNPWISHKAVGMDVGSSMLSIVSYDLVNALRKLTKSLRECTIMFTSKI